MKVQLLFTDVATSFVPRALALALCAAPFACGFAHDASRRAGVLPYEVVATHPHDARSFTQGLAVVNGRLLESSGLYGSSALAFEDVASGAATQRKAVDPHVFAEGVASDGARIVQLTWQSGYAIVYDLALRPLGRLAYEGEGWGLAFDGRDYWMSDGSPRLTRRSAQDFAPLGAIVVRDGDAPVAQLNELEYAGGRLYANVWHSDRIAVIDPASGAVRHWIDLSALKQGFAKPPGWNEAEHVLNGVAFDPASGHFYVTGKCWPVLYEIRLLPAAAAR